MPLPLIPIALAGSTLAGGFLAGSAMTKKESASSNSVFPESAPFSVNAQTYAPETHSPYEQFSQVVQYAPVTSIQYPDYAVNINSPEAVAQTKKTQTTTSTPQVDYTSRQAENSGNAQGTDMITLALVAGAALIAYGVVRR